MEYETIELEYRPRAIWYTTLHRELTKYRYAVIVAHRRFGKTVGMVNHMIRDAMNCEKISPRFAFIGPFKNQMKKIAWEPLKWYSHNIEGVKVNNQELYVEFPTRHVGAAGARIYIAGADNPDNVRGEYFDGVVLDEYADMKPMMWSTVVFPAIQDRDGYCYFIGTPKGQNHFYELYKHAKEDPKWFAALYDVEHTGIFSEEQIKAFKEELSDVEYKQEFLCDFSQAAQNDLFSLEDLDRAFSKELTEKDVAEDEPLIAGGDIARYGDDSTVVFLRKGRMVYDNPRRYRGLNTMETADQFVYILNGKDKVDMMFIDVGNMGAGVIDRIRQLGFSNISEVAFQGAAQDKERYENIRCEMYFKLKEFVETGGALPRVPGLQEELATMRYKFSKRGRLMITPKEELKEKLNRSPDLADALALTFARPVALRRGARRGRHLRCNTDYCIMDNLFT